MVEYKSPKVFFDELSLMGARPIKMAMFKCWNCRDTNWIMAKKELDKVGKNKYTYSCKFCSTDNVIELSESEYNEIDN